MFFGIWWAWMGYTWFASAYDNDGVGIRLAVFVQIVGVLIIAAGIPRAFNDHDFTAMVLGYVVMRLAMVPLWLWAARSDPPRRVTALRYAFGITALQVLWVGFLFVPAGWQVPAFLVLAIGELCVPAWGENAEPTTWHPHHIADRYAAFTIIVLGESILSTMLAVAASVDGGTSGWDGGPHGARRRRASCARCGGCTSRSRPASSSVVPAATSRRGPVARRTSGATGTT
ncbi:MAG: low temperature requirement protein A [Candidatus Nanopelagicales bacterium]